MSGFSFGQPSQTPKTSTGAPQQSGFSFGGLGTQASAVGAPSTPTVGAASSPAPAGTGGFSFGAPAANSSKLSSATGGFGGVSLGTSATAATPTINFGSFGAPAATTVAPASGGMFSGLGTSPAALSPGFSLGKTTAAPTTASGTPSGSGLGLTFSSAAPAPAGFSLGATTTAAGVGFKLGGAASKAVTTATSSAGFGTPMTSIAAATPASCSLSTAAKTPAGRTVSFALPLTSPTAPTSGPVITTASSAPTSSGLGSGVTPKPTAATTSATAAASKSITFKELEGMVNEWHSALEQQEKLFLEQATQVNAWDRLLLANGEKIGIIHDAAEAVKSDQLRMEQELDYVAGQQRELDELLKTVEEAVEQDVGTLDLIALNDPLSVDGQRAAIYRSSLDLDANLNTMRDDLSEVIQAVNTRTQCETAGAAQEDETAESEKDPLMQVCEVLNAHMDSIRWLENTMQGIKEGLDEHEKERKIRASMQSPGRI